MESNINSVDQQIKSLDSQIDAENRRMEAHSQAKHEEIQRKIEEAREAVSAAESDLKALGIQRQEQSDKHEAVKQEGMAADKERLRIQVKIDDCRNMIEKSVQSEKNSYVPYGKQIKEVLEKIERMNWVGDKPLGPLGIHVKAKDAGTWGDLLRGQLGGFLTAFAVTRPEDRLTLKSLLERHQKYVALLSCYNCV